MNPEHEQILIDLIKKIAKPIVGEVGVEFLKEGDQWRINLAGDHARELIGYHGELVNAIQHIVRVTFHKLNPADRTRFFIDVNLAKFKREHFITEQIPELAKNDVLINGITYIIKNMSSYERKLVHDLLSEVKGLETLSVGDGFNRKLLIRPTSETGSMGLDNSKIIDINSIEDFNDKAV